MKYKMAAAVVLGTLLLGGCGGSDDVIDNIKQEIDDKNKPTETTTANWGLEKTVNTITHSALSTFVNFGFVDALVYGADEAVEGAPCSQGNYVKTSDKITFNNCRGLFDDDTAVSGVINLSTNQYQYVDFKISYDDGESSLVNGALKVTSTANDTSGTIETNNLKVVSTEIDDNKKSRTVEYNLSAFKTSFQEEGSNGAYSLSSEGIFKVKGSEIGDYSAKFNTINPFRYKSNDEDSDAYDGQLKVVDTTNDKNYSILIANNDAKTLMYQASSDGKQVINKTITWDEVYDY